MTTTLTSRCKERLTQHKAMMNALNDAGLKIGDTIETITTRTSVHCKTGWNAPSWGLSEYRLAWGADGKLVWQYVSGTVKHTTIPESWEALPWGRPDMVRLSYWATGLLNKGG